MLLNCTKIYSTVSQRSEWSSIASHRKPSVHVKLFCTRACLSCVDVCNRELYRDTTRSRSLQETIHHIDNLAQDMNKKYNIYNCIKSVQSQWGESFILKMDCRFSSIVHSVAAERKAVISVQAPLSSRSGTPCTGLATLVRPSLTQFATHPQEFAA